MAIVAFVRRTNHGPRPYSAYQKETGATTFTMVRSPDPNNSTTFTGVGDAQRAVQATRGGKLMKWTQVSSNDDGVELWISEGY